MQCLIATEAEMLGERIAEQAAHLDAATHRLLADLRALYSMPAGVHAASETHIGLEAER